jgi:hypothetical protein
MSPFPDKTNIFMCPCDKGNCPCNKSNAWFLLFEDKNPLDIIVAENVKVQSSLYIS